MEKSNRPLHLVRRFCSTTCTDFQATVSLTPTISQQTPDGEEQLEANTITYNAARHFSQRRDHFLSLEVMPRLKWLEWLCLGGVFSF